MMTTLQFINFLKAGRRIFKVFLHVEELMNETRSVTRLQNLNYSSSSKIILFKINSRHILFPLKF